MEKTWLNTILLEAGMDPDPAEAARDELWIRLIRRDSISVAMPKERRLIYAMARDPMVSLNRIIGRGDEGLPFFDAETRRLSETTLANALNDAGVELREALALAKKVVAKVEPLDFYRPVWKALGFEGEVELETLRLADWTSLRAGVKELEGLPEGENHPLASTQSASSPARVPPSSSSSERLGLADAAARRRRPKPR